jgi:RNA polymerase sigma-70 factor (ECF subfamily)
VTADRHDRHEQEDRHDAALLRAAAAGDPGAVTRLYAAHVDALYAFAFYRAGRDPALAEDIVHDTLLDALRHAPQFEPSRGDLRAFLLMRLRNVARASLRDHHRSHALATAWDQREATLVQIFQSLEGAPPGDELLARAETRELVHLAIAGLADNHRVALTRKYLHGDTLEALGQRLGVSDDAAKSLLARARRAFRDAFAALRPDPASTTVASTGRPTPVLREVRDVQ